jgi:hypothetical protein
MMSLQYLKAVYGDDHLPLLMNSPVFVAFRTKVHKNSAKLLMLLTKTSLDTETFSVQCRWSQWFIEAIPLVSFALK